MPWPSVLGRVVFRTGLALWRQRVGLIVAGLIVVAFGAYELSFAGPSAAPGGKGLDCADTAMTALTHVNDATARAAYACLGPDMRTTSEDQFVATLQQQAASTAQADRIAERQTPEGKIVFYTVSAGRTPPVGYIVYLDRSGKVTKLE